MNERPDGSTATLIGWALVAIGVIAAFFVGSTETITGLWLTLGLANLGIGLGVLLLSLGYLVRAIWFLPGREIEPQEIMPTPNSANNLAPPDGQIADCEFCDRKIRTPALPCSAFTDQELPALGPRVSDKTCRNELTARGYISE